MTGSEKSYLYLAHPSFLVPFSFRPVLSFSPLNHHQVVAMVLETSTGKVIALIIAPFLLRLLFSYLNSPLRSFPGPFWAQFTDLWRVLDYWRCTQIQTHQQLHERLGPAVRIGPNMISLSDPSLLKTVYSTGGDFVKVCAFLARVIPSCSHGQPTQSNFYEVADAVSNGHRLKMSSALAAMPFTVDT